MQRRGYTIKNYWLWRHISWIGSSFKGGLHEQFWIRQLMQLYSPDLLFLPIVINVNELQSGAVLAVGNINFILLFSSFY